MLPCTMALCVDQRRYGVTGWLLQRCPPTRASPFLYWGARQCCVCRVQYISDPGTSHLSGRSAPGAMRCRDRVGVEELIQDTLLGARVLDHTTMENRFMYNISLLGPRARPVSRVGWDQWCHTSSARSVLGAGVHLPGDFMYSGQNCAPKSKIADAHWRPRAPARGRARARPRLQQAAFGRPVHLAGSAKPAARRPRGGQPAARHLR